MNKNSNEQLSLMPSLVRGTSMSDHEKKYIRNNLHLTNKEIGEALNRTEASITKFLYNEQLKRNDYQLEQIRARVGANQRGENNPNWKNGTSENAYQYKLRSIAKYPDKHRARVLFAQAVKRGSIIPKENCEQCNMSGEIEGHHPDYSKPLEVVWLCRYCHVKADKLRRENEILETK